MEKRSIDFFILRRLGSSRLVGCFGGPRCHETAGKKKKQGENDKELEKEETNMANKNRHNFVAVSVGHFWL